MRKQKFKAYFKAGNVAFVKSGLCQQAQYIAKYKLHLALQMIITTDIKIIEIAFECGYSFPESLSRAFIRIYQCTPTQYRKQHRKVHLRSNI